MTGCVVTKGAALPRLQKILVSNPNASGNEGFADLLFVTPQAALTGYIRPDWFAGFFALGDCFPHINPHITYAVQLIGNEAKESRFLMAGNAICSGVRRGFPRVIRLLHLMTQIAQS